VSVATRSAAGSRRSEPQALELTDHSALHAGHAGARPAATRTGGW
jgi:hypothetical protein